MKVRIILGVGWGSSESNSNIPIPEPPPWDPWKLEEPPSEHCKTALHLRNRKDSTKQLFIRISCRSWNCSICGPILKKKWMSHLSRQLMNAENIYVIVISPEDWVKVYRRINRANGDFARITLNDGRLVVFNTAKEGVSLPPSLRDLRLKAAIDAATFNGRAIATSRGWKLPKEEKKKSEWEKVANLSKTVEQAWKIVNQLGLTATPFGQSLTKPDGFQVILPKNWLDDDELGFKRFLRRLKYIPDDDTDKV